MGLCRVLQINWWSRLLTETNVWAEISESSIKIEINKKYILNFYFAKLFINFSVSSPHSEITKTTEFRSA